MGVTIHYRGSIDEPERIRDLQRELADIAKSMGWESSLVDDDWAVPPDAVLVHEQGSATIKGHLGLKGISILAMALKTESLGNLSGLSAEDIASRIEDFLKDRP